MKLVRFSLQLLAASLRSGIRMIAILLLVASIALNLATVAISGVAAAVSGLYTTVTGSETVYSSLKRDLAKKDARLVQLERELKAVKRANVVNYRGKKVALKAAVDDTSDRIVRRAAVGTSRNVGSMAGEALPFVGVAVIAGVTALEVYDMCEVLKDMHELNVAFDPSLAKPDEVQTICSLEVPTREELWETVKSSPGDAWRGAKDAVPTLEAIRSIEVDWRGYLSLTKEMVSSAADNTKSGLGKLWGATVEGAADLIDDSRSLFREDGE